MQNSCNNKNLILKYKPENFRLQKLQGGDAWIRDAKNQKSSILTFSRKLRKKGSL